MAGPSKARRAIIAATLVVALVVVAGGGAVAAIGVDRIRGLIGADEVPVEYRAAIRDAARRCPVVPANVLAAQLASESSWRTDVVSPAGAIGLAQFMPEVWEQYGLDGNGDGRRDPTDPFDAIVSAAELNCVNAELVAAVPGDPLRNILAAYNAGFNQVRRYGGVPPFPETQGYVERVLTRAQHIKY